MEREKRGRNVGDELERNKSQLFKIINTFIPFVVQTAS